MNPLFDFKNVSIEVDLPIGKKKILDQMSFKIRPSVATGIIGLNGAGKTTSIKALLQLISIQSGEVLYQNQKNLTDGLKSQIGFLPERPYFYPFLNARELLFLHWQLLGKDSRAFEDSIHKVLNQVGLLNAKEQRLTTYSKGMLQRIGLAQALIGEPSILILDEPMSGLDPVGRKIVKEIMSAHLNEDKTLIFSTHYLYDIEDFCEDVVVIDKGKCIFQGKTSDLKTQGSLEDSFLKMVQ